MAAGDQISNEQELRETLLRAVDQQARRKARMVGALVAVLAAWIMSMFIFYDSCSGAPRPGEVKGRFETDLAEPGLTALPLDDYRCLSGHGQKFRGVELLSKDGAVHIQVHEDQVRGSFVSLRMAEREWVLDERHCPTLVIGLQSFEGRTAGGFGYNGTLELVCQLDQGRVDAQLSFRDCSD